jgi:hypothetical protein
VKLWKVREGAQSDAFSFLSLSHKLRTLVRSLPALGPKRGHNIRPPATNATLRRTPCRASGPAAFDG